MTTDFLDWFFTQDMESIDAGERSLAAIASMHQESIPWTVIQVPWRKGDPGHEDFMHWAMNDEDDE